MIFIAIDPGLTGAIAAINDPWKRSMGLTSDKSASIDRAKLLFPDAPLTLKRHHDRAESLLLAEYSRRTFVGQVAA